MRTVVWFDLPIRIVHFFLSNRSSLMSRPDEPRKPESRNPDRVSNPPAPCKIHNRLVDDDGDRGPRTVVVGNDGNTVFEITDHVVTPGSRHASLVRLRRLPLVGFRVHNLRENVPRPCRRLCTCIMHDDYVKRDCTTVGFAVVRRRRVRVSLKPFRIRR